MGKQPFVGVVAGITMDIAEFIATDRSHETGFPPGASGAEGIAKGLLASVLLHLVVAAAAVGGIAVGPAEEAPASIDLALLPAAEEATSGPPRLPAAPSPGKPGPTVAHVPSRSSPPAEPAETRSAPPAENASPPTPAGSFPTQAVSPATQTAEDPRGGASPTALHAPAPGSAPRFSNPPASALVGQDIGPGGAGREGAGSDGAAQYLEKNYAYIRGAIQRGAPYPSVARRMGWEGRVVVAFRILADGSVRDVRIVQGSGHPVLDRGAADAVRDASPFPRPPAEAEIITPVVYRLH